MDPNKKAPTERQLKNMWLEDANSWMSNHTTDRFIIDNSNQEIIRNLFLYFLGFKGKYDLQKGIWLEGTIGSGKSALLHIFSQFLRRFNSGSFRVDSTLYISKYYADNGEVNLWTRNDSGIYSSKRPVEIAFDELGRELGDSGTDLSNYMGNKKNVMQYILHERHILWQQTGLRTHITTNKTALEIENLYGDFIRDRRAEMFNIIPVTREKSWRLEE